MSGVREGEHEVMLPLERQGRGALLVSKLIVWGLMVLGLIVFGQQVLI
jgi:hypothetical protein